MIWPRAWIVGPTAVYLGGRTVQQIVVDPTIATGDVGMRADAMIGMSIMATVCVLLGLRTRKAPQ